MADLYLDTGMRGAIKLRKGIGNVWAEVTGKIYESGDSDFETTTYDIFLGCLKNNWTLTQGRTTEDIPFSCNNGTFMIDTDKTYTVSIDTRTMPAELEAALMGLKMYKGAVSGQTIKKQEKETCTYDAATDSITLDTFFTSVTAASDITKIVSVYEKSTQRYWSLVASGSEADADKTFYLDSTNPDLMFEGSAGAPSDGAEFVVMLQYEEDMADGDWKAIEDGETFAEELNLTLSWLVKVESGADRGKKGYIIAECKHCHVSGDLTIGGDTKAIENKTLEFNINFQDSGDVTLHYHALA